MSYSYPESNCRSLPAPTRVTPVSAAAGGVRPSAGSRQVETPAAAGESPVRVRVVATRLLREALETVLAAGCAITTGNDGVLVLAGPTWESDLRRLPPRASERAAVVLACEEPATARRAAVLGVACFVGPEDGGEELRSAVRAAGSGETYCSPSLMRLLLQAARPEDEPNSLLSRREREVAALAVEGCSNREIARALHVEETTVKYHMNQVFRKTGIRRRSQLDAVVRKQKETCAQEDR